ncbi:TRAP-type C4-dicarboxylate transport system permease small subunit [Alkalispirillum mobile]|uniref:TRAP transporter small permease protein n=1 Tax=Alkalispirillum mobile TaxID=85925 RepID=A0A498C594_9GAMM|nr:TRAP transporter small permease subunit [Alkalispirillum mobile]RLK50802.1 TRAP-type C4-dicarboxylate transport system permease small subunit [Alkalispirillum mobile]
MSIEPDAAKGPEGRLAKGMRLIDQAVEHVEGLLVGAGVLLMAVVAISNVYTRNFHGFSIPGTEDITVILLVIVTFMGIGFAARQGRHIAMTALYDQLWGIWRKGMLIFLSLGTSVLLFYLAYLGFDYVSSLHRRDRTFSGMAIYAWQMHILLPLLLALWAGYWLTWARGHHGPASWISALKRADIGVWISALAAGLALGWVLVVVIMQLLAEPGTGPLSWRTQLRQWIPYALVPLGLALGGLQFFLTALRNLMSRGIYRSFTQKEQYGDANPDAP